MKILFLDSYEFDGPSSEQSLCIVTEHSKWTKNIESFYRKTCKIKGIQAILTSEIEDLPAETKIGKLQYTPFLIQSLYSENILLLGNEKCIALIEEWDIHDYLIFYKHYFIRYCWRTTA